MKIITETAASWARSDFEEVLDKALDLVMSCMSFHECPHQLIDVKFSTCNDSDPGGAEVHYAALVIASCPEGVVENKQLNS